MFVPIFNWDTTFFLWQCMWVKKDWHRERVKRCLFWKSSPRSPLRILWGVLCCVCHYCHIPQNELFPVEFWTFLSFVHARTLLADIAEGCIFRSLVSFGDLGMLQAAFWQRQCVRAVTNLGHNNAWRLDAPWFAKRFCFISWVSFPTEFAFCQVLYPTKALALLESSLLLFLLFNSEEWVLSQGC